MGIQAAGGFVGQDQGRLVRLAGQPAHAAPGRAPPASTTHQRVGEHAISAEKAGASAVQLTCSSISPSAETARALVRIPVLDIDEPMVDRALELGTRIGIVATAPTTLQPTCDLLRARAQASGRLVHVNALLVEGAYAALFRGDLPRHDALVLQTINGLLQSNDVVKLAQASMAHVVEALAADPRPCSVLTSPRLALERAARVLSECAP